MFSVPFQTAERAEYADGKITNKRLRYTWCVMWCATQRQCSALCRPDLGGLPFVATEYFDAAVPMNY